MHAADPTGAEHPNPGPVRQDHRSRDRGRAVLSTCDDDREIASAALAHRAERSMREILDLLAREATRDAPGEHRDCRRHGTTLAHRKPEAARVLPLGALFPSSRTD